MENVIQMENLTKKFPGVTALKDVNLTIQKGTVVGLLGPNGSGKSTFLKILLGIQRPTRGKAWVFGRNPDQTTKIRVAFVPEVDSLYRWMKVSELLEFVRAFYPDWESERAKELLQFLALDPKRKIGGLSKGMKSRLKILPALARKAELLLLDEPLAGIDPSSRGKILEAILRNYRYGEETVVFSTHTVREAEPFFDRVVFLQEGEVFLEGNAEDLRAQKGKSIEDLFKEIFP